MREGELFIMSQRIKLLVKYENFILSLTENNCFKSIIELSMNINVFPDTLPDGKIIIKQNKMDKIFVNKVTKPIRATRTGNDVGAHEIQSVNGEADVGNMPDSNVQKLFEKLDMDPEIIKDVRDVLKKSSAKSGPDRLQNIESQLKKIAEYINQSL